MFSERYRSFAIRQDAAKGPIAIVAVLHHLTSAASDACNRDDEGLDLAHS